MDNLISWTSEGTVWANKRALNVYELVCDCGSTWPLQHGLITAELADELTREHADHFRSVSVSDPRTHYEDEVIQRSRQWYDLHTKEGTMNADKLTNAEQALLNAVAALIKFDAK